MGKLTWRLRGLCSNKIALVISSTLILFIVSTFVGPLTREKSVEITLESFNQLANKEDYLRHVEDMHRLQKSIIIELGQLEQKRNDLRSSVDQLMNNNKDADIQLKGMERNLAQLKADVHNMLLTRAETLTDYSAVPLPAKILQSHEEMHNLKPRGKCRLHSCFDYSRCSVASGFPVYLYPIYTDDNVLLAWKSAISKSQHISHDPETACMFIALYQDNNDLKLLKYWNGDGRNHLIVNVGLKALSIPKSRAMIAQMEFNNSDPIATFDVALPYMNLQPLDHNYLPLLLPVRRGNLVSFCGNAPTAVSEIERGFITALSNLHSPQLGVNISIRCVPDFHCPATQWCFCIENKFAQAEKNSTFIAVPNYGKISREQFTYRIYIALVNGAIPVILGTHYELPMREVIPWKRAVIILPVQRVTELVYILRNILEPDIISYKKQGRLILENNLISIRKVAETLITMLRTRINIPPPEAPIPTSNLIYDKDHPMPSVEVRVELINEPLGPIEDAFPSPQYQRNFTSWLHTPTESLWRLSSNLYPNTPWDPILPTDAKYHGSSYGFRPINGGAGGSGKEFSESLGGNHPREQFTIVILTYDRAELLQQQIAQFNGLPYLNRVVVIWNNREPPPATLQWPRIHVDIKVIKAARNSLNNRFLPFKEIETEAVLSMDDDMYLRHDEIVFAFRAWRESRDRIVGFPGRYHAWNSYEQLWNYNSNHSCELSMVLTGAAFFHKYYMYQYSYFMPQAIRDKVDDFMNCEDLAMNFLVSHITGKPPVKTTSRWTFRCPTCGETALWIDESHFNERHQCIQLFTQVYGYLPLLYTQLRTDSVLFKTRVPQDKSKCFTLV